MTPKSKTCILACLIWAVLVLNREGSCGQEKYFMWQDEQGVVRLSREKPQSAAKASEVDVNSIIEVGPDNLNEANKIGQGAWRNKPQEIRGARSGAAGAAKSKLPPSVTGKYKPEPLPGQGTGKGGYVGYNIDTGEMVNITPDGKGGYNLRAIDSGQKFEISPNY